MELFRAWQTNGPVATLLGTAGAGY